jgi:hypothetical protein
VIVCFAHDPTLPRLWRRMVVSWDWGRSKFARCRYDPPDYTGRAVDVAFWVIPDRPDPALREWLGGRAGKHPDPGRKPDLAHEPVVLIRPASGLGCPGSAKRAAAASHSAGPKGSRRRSPSSSVE